MPLPTPLIPHFALHFRLGLAFLGGDLSHACEPSTKIFSFVVTWRLVTSRGLGEYTCYPDVIFDPLPGLHWLEVAR